LHITYNTKVKRATPTINNAHFLKYAIELMVSSRNVIFSWYVCVGTEHYPEKCYDNIKKKVPQGASDN
jgi:hypothetical protein